MTYGKRLLILNLGMVLGISSEALAVTKRRTVGDLLANARQASRGGQQASGLRKSTTSLPQAQLKFEQKTATNFEAVKPPRGSDLMRKVENSDQAKYERVLDEQIQELFKLTQKFKNSANRGELWLRLAEVYVEKAALIDGRSQDEYDAKLKAYREGKIKIKPILDQSNAREYNRKAIRLYEWFEKDFPRDPKMSQALFFLGYNYFELGNTKKGVSYYSQLNKQFPSSPFVGESHFALGEYYFENDKWADSYREYAHLIKSQGHRLHTFALYKGAWCLYRLGEYQKGLKYLETIIRRSRDQAAGKGDNRSRLESEALRDIVVFYAAQGKPNEAANYFHNLLDSDDVFPLVDKLAYYYSDKGEKEAARQLFKQLIAEKPGAAKAFEYQYQIVQNYFYSKNSPLFKDELYRWVKDYGPESAWGSGNQDNKTLMENSYKLRETTLRNWILQQHQTAQNSRAPHSRALAADGYELYLREFAQSSYAVDMHFYYGELLYDIGKFDLASQQYRLVVDAGPKSKFYDKAGVNLIHAAEKSIPSDQELQKRVGESVEAFALDPRVERFIKAAQWHLEKFPNSDKNPEVKFRIGRLYYLHNQFDEANKYFSDVVKNHPKSKFSIYSANLMLDIFNLKKDYAGLEKAGGELLAVPSIAGSKTGQEIRGVLEKANFKKAQDLEVDKKYGESAAQFESFAKQNPRSELAVTAWFNAGVNYERANRGTLAVRSYGSVLSSSSPEGKTLKPKARRLLAKLYQDSGQFEEAARLYAEAAKESPQGPLTANFIYNAALMNELVGKPSQAIGLYLEYRKMVKKNSERLEATYAVAEIYRRGENASATIQTFKDYLDLNPSSGQKVVEAHYWIWYNSNRLHRRDADEWKEKTLAVQRRLARSDKSVGSHFAAQIKLGEASRALESYKRIEIPAAPEKQKKAVDRKVESLGQLTKLLNEVAKFESAEEVVSSLAILGEANLHMAQAIVNSPLPPGLNAEEKKVYGEGMAKFSEPFMTKAKEAFKAAVERGYELEVYGDGFQKAREFMASNNNTNYYDQDEVGFDTRYLNWIQ